LFQSNFWYSNNYCKIATVNLWSVFGMMQFFEFFSTLSEILMYRTLNKNFLDLICLKIQMLLNC